MIDFRMDSPEKMDITGGDVNNDNEEPAVISSIVPLKASTTRQSKLNATAGKNLGVQMSSVAEDLAELYPKWIVTLLPAYKYVSKEANDKKKNKFLLECKLCENACKKSGKTYLPSIIQDTQAKAFITHLKRKHSDDEKTISVLNDYTSIKKVHETPENIKAGASVRNVVTADLYSRNDPQQIRFINQLLKFIVVDGAALNTPEGKGFRELIKSIDPKLNVPNRTTITRKIDKKFEVDLDKLKMKLSSLPPSSCHLLADIWTSKQNRSVLGITSQFFNEDWVLCHQVLGFRHFPMMHSGQNIRDVLQNFLATSLNLSPETISTVTADNAANIRAAFYLNDSEKGEGCLDLETDSQDFEEPADDDEHGLFTLADMMQDAEEWMAEPTYKDEGPPLEVLLTEGIGDWLGKVLQRNPCLAHLLQLAIKDALRDSPFFSTLLKKVQKIIYFFCKSSKYTEMLRVRTDGMALLKIGITRWNSTYDALNRISQVKREVDMASCINSVLSDAKAEKSALKEKDSKIPASLSQSEIETLRLIVRILKPFAIYTDQLQADGITASTVILGLVTAVRACGEVDITEAAAMSDWEETDLENLVNFKGSLIRNVSNRFTTKTGSTKSRLFKLNVFEDNNYICAAFLDPRIKTSIFGSEVLEVAADDSELNKIMEEWKIIYPKETDAKRILKAKSEVFKKMVASSLPSTTSTEKGEGAPVIKKSKIKSPKKSKLFDLIRSKVDASQSIRSASTSFEAELEKEIGQYLGESLLGEENDPSEFWKQREKDFKHLSTIAKSVLAMPASSGGVERLFSIAGAIARSRRSRLTIENIEKILMCRSNYSNK